MNAAKPPRVSKAPSFRFKAEAWIHPGPGGWHFLTLPPATARKLRTGFDFLRKRWGMLAVKATVNDVAWKTSVFPDAKSGSFLLPLKAEIRKKTGVKAGDLVDVRLEIEV